MCPYKVTSAFQERSNLSLFFKVIFKIYALYSDIFDKHMLVLLKRNEFSCLYMKNQRSLAMFLSLFSLLQVYVHYFRATTQSPGANGRLGISLHIGDGKQLPLYHFVLFCFLSLFFHIPLAYQAIFILTHEFSCFHSSLPPSYWACGRWEE